MGDFPVSSKEEVDSPAISSVKPVDLNDFFDGDGKIYGYQGLKVMCPNHEIVLLFLENSGFSLLWFCSDVILLSIYICQINVWINSISLHSYADITYQSTINVSVDCICYSLGCLYTAFQNVIYYLILSFCYLFQGDKGITDLKSALQVSINSQV